MWNHRLAWDWQSGFLGNAGREPAPTLLIHPNSRSMRNSGAVSSHAHGRVGGGLGDSHSCLTPAMFLMACLAAGVEEEEGYLGRQEADKSALRSQVLQRTRSTQGEKTVLLSPFTILYPQLPRIPMFFFSCLTIYNIAPRNPETFTKIFICDFF